MTQLTVPIAVRAIERALAKSARAAESGADLVEFRIDTFTQDPPALADLVERSTLPCIITCRSVEEGGFFEGNDGQRLALFEQAIRGGPAYLDVELAVYQRSAHFRQAIQALVRPGAGRSARPRLIFSSHDLRQRPADLYRILEAMSNEPICDVIKVAWHARTLRDNIEAFEVLLQQYKPTIALCMGESGLASRVLARKFSALLTFATLDSDSATAPGQPTLVDLVNCYRWNSLRRDTQIFGVIGYPVRHSMSPAIHNAGFEATGFNGVYLPMPILPEFESFKATVGQWLGLEPLHFRGASVTIPHKENLLRFVDQWDQGPAEVEQLAQKIGAANTLVVRPDGSLYAANTDYAAAIDALCDSLDMEREGLATKSVAVIGAGGVARAVVAGLAHYGATVVVYNRTLERAEELAAGFSGGAGKVVAARLEKLCDSCCQVYINCTSVGMHPDIDQTPMPTPPDAWGPGTVVFDTIYNPLETKWMLDAKASGCLTIPGTEMFVRQAAAQFKLWTGLNAPLEQFRAVLLEQLGELGGGA